MSSPMFADSKKYAPSKRTGFRKFSEAGLSTYLMLSPFALLFIVFAVYPVLASLRLSFMRYNAICNPDQSPCGSVGFGNYQYLIMDDSRFHKALLNTTLYVIGSVIMGMIASLTLALALQEDTRSNEGMPGALIRLLSLRRFCILWRERLKTSSSLGPVA